MNKLISKVTLIAFIYQSLLAPLAAMENSGPIKHNHDTAVVQVEAHQDQTTVLKTVQTKASKVKQHTATASMATPWKRALEYYRWGQYRDMAGEMCLTTGCGLDL